jgi:signal transduction histidine kinase
VISAGRKLEQGFAGPDLTLFLELRRHERNVMLNKDRAALEAFIHKYEASPFGKYPEIENYRVLMTKLIRLYEEENASVDAMRLAARKIQSFTQNLAQEVRRDMSRTIKTSTTLLVVAVVLIIVLGIIINIKLATSIAVPVRNLERITKKIMQGDFSENIEVKGHDEIAVLAKCYNQMEEKLDLTMTSLGASIDKLRKKQAQLVEAEKLAAVGKLAAGIAHEINNPLTSVLTFSNLMLERCPAEDPCCARLRLMARETERARNIVRQLLHFGRETVIKPIPINVNQPVTEISETLMAQEAFKGIDLSMRLADNLPEVNADPAQIGQVILNILLNAIHAITPPGRIDVVTRIDSNHVEISIRDSGKGVPKEHLNRIFDPFFTTKDASIGTGLGLAVSYNIMKKHGGDITVQSEEGKGTTFTVRLPVSVPDS